jgi:hypothetical protein
VPVDPPSVSTPSLFPYRVLTASHSTTHSANDTNNGIYSNPTITDNKAVTNGWLRVRVTKEQLFGENPAGEAVDSFLEVV